MTFASELVSLRPLIEEAYARPGAPTDATVLRALDQIVDALDTGRLRVATEVKSGEWTIHTWIKMAILLYFRARAMEPTEAGPMSFMDKIPLKRWDSSSGVRVVPPAVARKGAHIERGAILMPSYVNIGAWVGEGTMVDTWATVGSCAQIGRHVHLSGGVGIGGVLEPLQAAPVIIEDHAFIGSRCIVVEGVHVESGAVLGAGVTLTGSTRILDVSMPGPPVEYRGRVPRSSVVIPGSLPKEFPAGTFQVPCALIIGRRSESTDRKTSLTSALRDFSLSV